MRRRSHFRQFVFVVSVDNQMEMPYDEPGVLAHRRADKAGDEELKNHLGKCDS